MAICHEVGNLLAAVRLSAHLLDKGMDPAELHSLAADLESVSAQAGAVLAHIRPLLAEGWSGSVRVSVDRILARVEDILAQPDESDVSVEVQRNGDLPSVRLDVEAFQHLLLSLARGASGARRVRIGAEAVDGEVVFSVENDGPSIAPEFEAEPRHLRGLVLVLEVADSILSRWGGRAIVETVAKGNRIDLRLPVSAPDD